MPDDGYKHWSIRCHSSGLCVFKHETEVDRVSWHSVRALRSWKIDCWSYDLVCLGIDLDGPESTVVVNEDMQGWKELCDAIRSAFDGIDEAWPNSVAFPAFETNYTVLWERAKAR
jgi:hypothetical protein